MAPLDDLPPELLLRILECIRDRKTLAILSATSKGIHSFVIPTLYARYKNTSVGWLPTAKSFRPFLRTVIACPELAAHCKSVQVSWNISSFGAFGYSDLGKDDLIPTETLIEAATTTRIISDGWKWSNGRPVNHNAYLWTHDAERTFIQHLADGSAAAEVILMLAHLPLIQHLVFSGLPKVGPADWPWNEYLRRMPHRFQNLRSFNGKPFHWKFDLEDYLFFFQLPALSTFTSIEMTHRPPSHVEHRVDLESWVIPSRSSMVTNLKLVRCSIPPDAVAVLVTACVALEHLQYIPHGKCLENYVPLDNLMQAILLHKNSLRSLIVSWFGPHDEEQVLPLGSLCDFYRLRYIELHSDLLPGNDLGHVTFDNLLPRSVECLAIHESDYPKRSRVGLDAALMRLLVLRKKHWLRLARVILAVWDLESAAAGFGPDRKTIFSQASVDLDIVPVCGRQNALQDFPGQVDRQFRVF